MIAIGADPGLSGAIALVDSTEGVLEIASLPVCDSGAGPNATVRRKVDARRLLAMMCQWWEYHRLGKRDVVGAVERMAYFASDERRASPTTMLSLQHSAGVIEGVVAPLCREFQQVLPQKWKSYYGIRKDTDGQIAIDTARLFYPGASGLRTHDRCEAVLIARWMLVQSRASIAAARAAEPDPLLA